MCICTSFLPIHKYKHIGKIYYHFPLRPCHKFRYAPFLNRCRSISQKLLGWLLSNFDTMKLRFSPIDIIGSAQFDHYFYLKINRFNRGLKKACLVVILLRFFNHKYLENYWSNWDEVMTNKMYIMCFYTHIPV